MKNIFQAGDIKEHRTVVKLQDVAAFNGLTVHNVCSTFALAREIEWTTRLFVLEMKEAHEEGVGTFLEIRHEGPAFVGEEIVIQGIYETVTGVELTCSFVARVGDQIIARGKTGQKILTLEKIKSIFGHG